MLKNIRKTSEGVLALGINVKIVLLLNRIKDQK